MRLVLNKLGALGIAASLAFIGTACSKKKSSGASGAGSVTEDQVPEEGPREDLKPELAASYGLLNFRQLAATYSSVTGVTLGTPEVKAEYDKQVSSLPKSYDAATVSAAKVSAATKLAGAFCDAMSLNDALLTQKLGSGIAALGNADASTLAADMLNAFYGPETSLQGDRSADVETVATLITELRTVQSPVNPDDPTLGTQAAPASSVFMGACSAILSSAEFYMY